MKARMYAMAALAGMMTLAGCNNQDEPGTDNRPLQGTPIRVTTQVTEPETRTEMMKEDLTEFYFRVTGESGATGAYNHFTKMTLSGGEWVPESGEITWGDATAQVSAVAQKTADDGWQQWTQDGYDGGQAVSVLADQSSTATGADGFPTDENVKASDLLYMPATPIDPNAPGDKVNAKGEVLIAMKHAFAKLDITVNVGTALGGNGETNPITSLTVDGTQLKATFAPAAGAPLVIADADNDPATITARNYGYTAANLSTNLNAKAEAQYECIVLPQPLTAKQLKVTATIGGETYTYTHPSTVTFSENKKYRLTLNVGKNSMSLDGNVDVGGFEEDDKSDIGGGELQGPITITPSNEQQTLTGGNGERYIIEGDGKETTGRIVIEGGDAEVTLKNVNIKAAIVDIYGEAIEVKSGTVTFILEGENKLTAGYGAALYNAQGSTIVLKGEGKLIAQAGNGGAGIGGSEFNRNWGVERHAGVIQILSGNIEAKGSSGCSGIGAGSGNCQGVEISGGTVKATAGGSYASPAIGNSNVGGVAQMKCEYVTLKDCVLYFDTWNTPIEANTTTPDLSKADEAPAAVRDALDDTNVKIYNQGTEESNRWPATN